MKRFLLMLTVYSSILLCIISLIYYFVLLEPMQSKLETRLDQHGNALETLTHTLEDLKSATARLEARSTVLGNRSLSAIKSSTIITDSDADTAPLTITSPLQPAGGPTLAETNPKAGTGGMADDDLLIANSRRASHDLPAGVTPDPTPPTDMALGFLAVASTITPSVDVYPTQTTTVKPIGHIKIGNAYPYLQKTVDWYQIRISVSTTGWVPAALVKEVSGS